MFFLSDYQSVRFKRGRDKNKRKSKVGSLKLLTIPAAANLGTIAGLGYVTTQLARKKSINMKTLGYTTAGGIGTGAVGGYIVGDKLDKRMKTGRYER